MLIASSSSMVGAMKSQAMPRSESPRRRRPKAGGVASARRPITDDFSAISLIGSGLDRSLCCQRVEQSKPDRNEAGIGSPPPAREYPAREESGDSQIFPSSWKTLVQS